jgi:transposase
MGRQFLPQIAQKFPTGSAKRRRAIGAVVSELIHCQKVVEQMLTLGWPLAEIEDYIEDCALEQLEKAGLWMLVWAHQDPATQLRLAKETLALALSLQSATA